jgi:hypothetical protein
LSILVKLAQQGYHSITCYTQYSLAQLKIMQEVITLWVFVPFAMLYRDQPFKLDYVSTSSSGPEPRPAEFLQWHYTTPSALF